VRFLFLGGLQGTFYFKRQDNTERTEKRPTEKKRGTGWQDGQDKE